MRSLIPACLFMLLLAPMAFAAESADVSAQMNATALPAGGQAMLAIVIDVHPGLHAQSHHPGSDDYIPLEIRFNPAAGVTVGEIRYPPGTDETYPELGKLNVYVNRVIIYVPISAAADATPGALKLSGKVNLQACNSSACFPPENDSFEITISVVARGTPVAPNHLELFDGSAATISPSAATTSPATSPADAPPLKTPAIGAGTTVLGLNLTHGGLPLALIAAFVVGILFNAMPCVLPVVPLKIMGFYEVSKHSRGKCVALGAVFSAGLIFIFAVLAVLIVVLHVIDWGGLFQRTWFTVAITIVLLGMALGTFGFFGFALPGGMYALSPRHDTYTGNFLFGMLTAALSTPCTFGLFVALLTWALARPAVEGFAVFITVGIGMAFPYFLLSLFPELARRFPRTGPWSNMIKQEMGFLLLVTAIFFAQPLLGYVMPINATWWLMFATIAAAALFLFVRAGQLSTTRWPVAVAAVIALATVGAAGFTIRGITSQPYKWRPYTPAALDAAISAGHAVVIDFTATWCSNCHWLEGTVLHDKRVVATVARDDVVMLRADVTYDDAVGQKLLNKLDPTHAIPLTAVYAPHAGADARPAILNGIYSADDLVRMLAVARGK